MAKRVSDEGKVRVLVYGTLKQGHTNGALLERVRANFMGYSSIVGPFKMLDLGPFPALFDTKGEDNEIRGEVYAMEEEALAHLDFYEGHPNFFQRRKLWTSREIDGEMKRVWVYFQTIDELDDEIAGHVCKDGLWQPMDPERNFWAKQNNPF